jgi:transcriptional regulator with XRE-family HTH domain
MRFEEKLRREMLLKGFNQQKLARASGVSDSEVSRILAGKSQPGLENALKLSRAVDVSLDYLADDSRESDSARAAESPWERELLDLAAEVGVQKAAQLLMAARTLGFDLALRRLYGLESARPIIEVAGAGGPAPRGAKAPTGPSRASSA